MVTACRPPATLRVGRMTIERCEPDQSAGFAGLSRGGNQARRIATAPKMVDPAKRLQIRVGSCFEAFVLRRFADGLEQCRGENGRPSGREASSAGSLTS